MVGRGVPSQAARSGNPAVITTDGQTIYPCTVEILRTCQSKNENQGEMQDEMLRWYLTGGDEEGRTDDWCGVV
jgi:hypothetical protein